MSEPPRPEIIGQVLMLARDKSESFKVRAEKATAAMRGWLQTQEAIRTAEQMAAKREWVEKQLRAAWGHVAMTGEQSRVIQAALGVLSPKDWGFDD